MKRIIILAALAIAITGCYNNPSEYFDASEIVTFSTDAVTRGTPINDASQLTDIGTFGYYTGQNNWTDTDLPNRMFNQRLYRDGSDWKYDGAPVRWDGNSISDLFTFYAYAPFATADNGIVVNGDANTTGVPTLTYTVPIDVTKQPDLMVAVPRVDITRPSSGYVSLNMQHALTTIGFQIAGNGERVTGIALSGVSMTGTLKTDGGNIEWTGLGGPEDADFSASINFDAGRNYYTATPTMSTGLMADNGYLMMIPQELGSTATIVVTYENGETLEVDIDPHGGWLPGKKLTYMLTIVQGGVIVVEPSDITMPYTFSMSEILVDCSDNNGNPDPSLEWTLTSDQMWIMLSFSNNNMVLNPTISGRGTQRVYLYTTVNNSNSDRTGTISLNDIGVVTTVKQLYSTAQRFARSNIVMYVANGNKILTFAETEADHTNPKSVTYYDASTSSIVTGTVPAIPANVQGLHFRWGSLVGVTSNGTDGTAFNTQHVVYWPAEYTRVPRTWVFNNNGTSATGQVPYIDNAEIGANPYAAQWVYSYDVFKGYPNNTGPGFDKTTARGDICRYISDMGWVQGRWRMPTAQEFRDIHGETIWGGNGIFLDAWDMTYERISGNGTDNKYGYYPIPDVRLIGKGVNGSERASNSLPNPGFAKVAIPASGYRAADTGRLTNPGYYSLTWSATPSWNASFAFNLDFNGTNNSHPSNSFARNNGYSVRCISDE